MRCAGRLVGAEEVLRARALATIARSLAVYVAIVAGAAAIGAVVGVLVLGEWFIGAGLVAWLAAWLALPIATNTLVTRDVVIRRTRLRR